MLLNEVTEEMAQHATLREVDQLRGTMHKMYGMLHQNKFDRYMALRQEVQVFYCVLLQRAAKEREGLTSCQLQSGGHPISCSAPPAPFGPRTWAPLPSSC